MKVLIQNLEFSYLDKQVFKNFDLEVHPGRPLLVRGSSGSGKSTLLKLCAGLLQAASGKLEWGKSSSDNLSPAEVQKLRFDQMLYVDQDMHLIPHWSVRENLQLLITQATELDSIIEQFELSKLLEQKCSKLSGGQKQLVMLARAYSRNADLLLLDEPTAHLDDSRVEKQFRSLVQKYQNSQKSLLVTSHDPRIQNYFTEFKICAGQ